MTETSIIFKAEISRISSREEQFWFRKQFLYLSANRTRIPV